MSVEQRRRRWRIVLGISAVAVLIVAYGNYSRERQASANRELRARLGEKLDLGIFWIEDLKGDASGGWFLTIGLPPPDRVDISTRQVLRAGGVGFQAISVLKQAEKLLPGGIVHKVYVASPPGSRAAYYGTAVRELLSGKLYYEEVVKYGDA